MALKRKKKQEETKNARMVRRKSPADSGSSSSKRSQSQNSPLAQRRKHRKDDAVAEGVTRVSRKDTLVAGASTGTAVGKRANQPSSISQASAKRKRKSDCVTEPESTRTTRVKSEPMDVSKPVVVPSLSASKDLKKVTHLGGGDEAAPSEQTGTSRSDAVDDDEGIGQVEAALRSLSDASEGEENMHVEEEVEEQPMFENLFEKRDTEASPETTTTNKTNPSWKEVVTLSHSPSSCGSAPESAEPNAKCLAGAGDGRAYVVSINFNRTSLI